MTGIAEFNRPEFFRMAEHVKACGEVPLNPATLPDGLSQAEYMDICIAMIRCATKAVMRHIIRGDPTPLERKAAEAALSAHQSRYGDYGRRKVAENYRFRLTGSSSQ
uniref:Uncharacterized protein n=1 Tax=Anopheles maculatus TaxID=74869 RepID=A0A182SKD4_9DIPT